MLIKHYSKIRRLQLETAKAFLIASFSRSTLNRCDYSNSKQIERFKSFDANDQLETAKAFLIALCNVNGNKYDKTAIAFYPLDYFPFISLFEIAFCVKT